MKQINKNPYRQSREMKTNNKVTMITTLDQTKIWKKILIFPAQLLMYNFFFFKVYNLAYLRT